MERIDKFHRNCFACSGKVSDGLKLKFILLANGTISGKFRAGKNYQGYDNILHGGIISTILDSSMVNLFYLKEGLALKTAKLNVRFRKPIPVKVPVTIKAAVDHNSAHFYKAKSQIICGKKIFAEAEGYFRK
jgi:acyl-coenzyme A thioesterase PaaI-like protein